MRVLAVTPEEEAANWVARLGRANARLLCPLGTVARLKQLEDENARLLALDNRILQEVVRKKDKRTSAILRRCYCRDVPEADTQPDLHFRPTCDSRPKLNQTLTCEVAQPVLTGRTGRTSSLGIMSDGILLGLLNHVEPPIALPLLSFAC